MSYYLASTDSRCFDRVSELLDRRVNTLEIARIVAREFPTLSDDEITKIIGLAWGP